MPKITVVLARIFHEHPRKSFSWRKNGVARGYSHLLRCPWPFCYKFCEAERILGHIADFGSGAAGAVPGTGQSLSGATPQVTKCQSQVDRFHEAAGFRRKLRVHPGQ